MYAMFVEMRSEFVTAEVVTAVSANVVNEAPTLNRVDHIGILKEFGVKLDGLSVNSQTVSRYILGLLSIKEAGEFERHLELNVNSEEELTELYKKLDFITDVVGKKMKLVLSNRYEFKEGVNKYALTM